MTVNQTELWRSLRTGACVASLLLCPAHVTWAQQNGGIAGVVRDAAGAVAVLAAALQDGRDVLGESHFGGWRGGRLRLNRR